SNFFPPWDMTIMEFSSISSFEDDSTNSTTAEDKLAVLILSPRKISSPLRIGDQRSRPSSWRFTSFLSSRIRAITCLSLPVFEVHSLGLRKNHESAIPV